MKNGERSYVDAKALFFLGCRTLRPRGEEAN